VTQTEDGELVIEDAVATPSSYGKAPKRGSVAQRKSIFEDDDEEEPKKGHSMFSDEEDGEDFDDNFDGDGSSGIGSEDDMPHMDDEIDEESAVHMRPAAPREPGWVVRGSGKTKGGKSSANSFVRGGYDYGKHMKPVGEVPGGVFVSKDGKVSELDGDDSSSGRTGKTSSSRPQLLPEDLFASKPSKEAVKADAHDRMYGLLEEIDPEVRALLDSDNDDSGDENEEDPDNALDDDFVMQAIQPVEGEDPELDVRAYLDRIIRTGRLPHELEDPFGDELEDIDEFLSNVPKGMKGPKASGKQTKSTGGLDDIDDDFEPIPKSKSAKKGQRVRFEDDEEDEEDEEYDSDMFEEDEEDEDLSDTERKARGMGRAIPGRAPLTSEEAARAMRKFETALADYDETMELEYDDPAVRGHHDVNNFTDILDDFLDDAVLLGLRTANSKGEIQRKAEKKQQVGDSITADTSDAAVVTTATQLKQVKVSSADADEDGGDDEDGEDSTEDIEVYFEGKEEPQWDVESYVSTYTNTENHPRLVQESALNRRIQIGRGGVPTGVLEHERKKMAKSEKVRRQQEDEAYLASRKEAAEKVNLGVARPKKETAEERRARKEALKVEKRANRETKKELKESFRKESVRQHRQEAGTSRATIVHM
jgi:protein LTV1